MSTAKAQQIKVTLPTSIAGCQVWFDAADTSTMTFSGNNLSTWVGKGLSPITATATGTIVYEAYQGKKALRFNGTDSKMTTNAIASYGASATTWITASVNLTAVTGSTPTDASLVFATSGSPEKSIRYTQNPGSQLYTFNNGSFRDSRNFDNGVKGFIDTAASFTAYVNGSDATFSTSAVTYQAGTNQSFLMGQWGSGTLNGYIQEIIVYDSALTLTQYQQVEGYLAWKWGYVNLLPDNHPYKTNNIWAPIYPAIPYTLPDYVQSSPLFTPLQISNCVLWLDAADKGTLCTDSAGTTPVQNSGDIVSYWGDKSTSANHATNTTSQPSVLFPTQNNLSVVNFSGAQLLNLSASLLPNGSTPFSFFFVFKTTSAATQVYFSYGRTSGGVADNGKTPQFYISSGNLINDLYGSSAISDTNNYQNTFVLSEVTGADTFNGYDNGSSFAGTNGVNITLQTLTSFASIGAGQASGSIAFYLTGQIAEVIAYNRVVLTTERQQLEYYLMNKWGFLANLAAGNPYKVPGFFALSPFPSGPLVKQATNPKQYFIDIVSYTIFNWTSFSAGANNINTFGNASFLNNEIRLTPNSGGQAGSAYFQKKLLINKTFTTTFNLRFENTQADGAAFVIQNYASNALGTTGGGLGYSNVTNSLAIRFDTWNGTGGQFSTDVLTGGSVPTDQGASGVLNSSLGLTAGQTWRFYVLVSYNGSSLSYTITNTANGSNFSSNAAYNIQSYTGTSNAWIGFSAGTGGSTEGCFISAWNWSNSK